MAIKKTTRRKTTTRRAPARRRSTTAAAPRRRTTRRRSLASPAAIKSSVNDVLMGAIGGAIAGFAVENIGFVKNQNDTNKALIVAGIAIATGAFAKRPAIAAGMAGVASMRLLKGLNVLADKGSMMIPPISEGMPMQQIPYGLASDGMVDYAGLNDIYPSYGNLVNF